MQRLKKLVKDCESKIGIEWIKPMNNIIKRNIEKQMHSERFSQSQALKQVILRPQYDKYKVTEKLGKEEIREYWDREY